MKLLIIINDAPYGTEKMYNALRHAMAIKTDFSEIEIRIFLMSDSVTGALPQQNTPNGYYNIEKMLTFLIKKGVQIKLCGSCVDARGLSNLKLVEGVEVAGIADLAKWSVEADKIICY